MEPPGKRALASMPPKAALRRAKPPCRAAAGFDLARHGEVLVVVPRLSSVEVTWSRLLRLGFSGRVLESHAALVQRKRMRLQASSCGAF